MLPTLISNGRTLSLLIDKTKTYIFDLAGRPLVLTKNGRTFVRGLDGRVKEKSWEGSSDALDRSIRDLDENEIRGLTTELFTDIEAAQTHIKTGGDYVFQLSSHPLKNDFNNTDAIFSQLLYWSPDQLFQDAEAFHRIYLPVNILPPDQYFSIPIQVVEGCPWNKCSFCNFYQGRKFRVRSFDEIMNHIEKVKIFLGRSAELRRSVFLCDANAFAMRPDEFSELLKVVRETFSDQMTPGGGIFTFADIPTILGKTRGDLSAFAQAGLRRVYIGMESGSNTVRDLIQKRGGQKYLIEAVAELKAAGLDVGLIVLLGVGGKEYEKIHLTESTSVLKKMNLGPRDLVYFSPFYPSENTAYTSAPTTAHLTPLKKNGIRRQYRSFLSHLTSESKQPHPRTAVYDIREFVV